MSATASRIALSAPESVPGVQGHAPAVPTPPGAATGVVDSDSRAHPFTSRSAKGAAGEMFACGYLLAQGYHVFRSVSPSCPVDGIAYRDGECLRFEVKSLTVINDGSQGHCVIGWPRNEEWDLLVLVRPNGVVHEFRAPATYEEVRDALRAHYGLPESRQKRKEPAPPPPRPPVAHGTWGGYCEHKTQKTKVCDPCRAAADQYRAEQSARSLKYWATKSASEEGAA